MGVRLTSRYTLVVHDVSTDRATLWVGALLPSLGKPKNWRLIITDVVNKTSRIQRFSDGWIRPFKGLNKRFCKVVTVKNLVAGTAYTVEFQARYDNKYKTLEVAYLDTLPNELPGPGKKPFVIGLGSCFYCKHDGGRVGQAYQALYEDKIHLLQIKKLLEENS